MQELLNILRFTYTIVLIVFSLISYYDCNGYVAEDRFNAPVGPSFFKFLVSGEFFQWAFYNSDDDIISSKEEDWKASASSY
jgi:hypothetical protein